MIDTAPEKTTALKKSWRESTLAPLVKNALAGGQTQFTTSDEHMVVVYGLHPDGDASAYLETLGFPGEYPSARRAAEHVPRSLLDHAPVRRLWQRREATGATVPHRPGPDGCRSLLTCPPQIGLTPTMNSPGRKWARSACRYRADATWSAAGRHPAGQGQHQR